MLEFIPEGPGASPEPRLTVNRKAPPFRVVTVTSNKGGVGKSTIATNLAVYARALREDLPVLVMSFDDQFLPERMFRLEGNPAEPTVVDVMRDRDFGSGIRLGQYGVRYVPSSLDVSEYKRELTSPFELRRILERSGWEGLVIIDTKSDLEILTQNAIAASDLAVIVVADSVSLAEAEKVYALLDAWGRPHEHSRILLSLVDLRVKYREGEHRDVLALLISEIRRRGYPLFETFISRSPKIESLYTNPEGRARSVLHAARESLVQRQLKHLATDLLTTLDRLPALPELPLEATLPQSAAPEGTAKSAAPADPAPLETPLPQSAEHRRGGEIPLEERHLVSVDELLGADAATKLSWEEPEADPSRRPEGAPYKVPASPNRMRRLRSRPQE
jgi:cellulose biosynthesis protein BcsQ